MQKKDYFVNIEAENGEVAAMEKTMDFISRYALGPESVNGAVCLKELLHQMELGLSGVGNIPMLPSFLAADLKPVPGESCCVLDAGGTNLRAAKAEFDAEGNCRLSAFQKVPMPGTQGEITAEEFYAQLASHAAGTGSAERVGLCFSYNVDMNRELDGVLLAWCKEVRVPDAPGKPVGASLKAALGPECRTVRVLNDSTAALLGACAQDPEVKLGLILGTGINICYPEKVCRIPKVPQDLRGDAMIISTEIGEFSGFPKNVFEAAVIAASDDPALAQAEKQCAGAYLGDVISGAWQTAAKEGILDETFLAPAALPTISDFLAGAKTQLPESAAAKEIARTMIHRAARIAAVLVAGSVLRSCAPGTGCKMVIEGSQYTRLTHFGEHFRKELDALLEPYKIQVTITQAENACLIGAAVAAFAESM